jgi:hypothetical protein
MGRMYRLFQQQLILEIAWINRHRRRMKHQ